MRVTGGEVIPSVIYFSFVEFRKCQPPFDICYCCCCGVVIEAKTISAKGQQGVNREEGLKALCRSWQYSRFERLDRPIYFQINIPEKPKDS